MTIKSGRLQLIQQKRAFYIVGWLVLVLVNEVNAQFRDNPISVAVDQVNVDFAFYGFEQQSNTCTKGAEAVTSFMNDFGSLPAISFFPDGKKSFSVDLNVTEAISDISEFGVVGYNRFEILSYDRFGRATNLIDIRSTTNGWRRMAFAIPDDSISIQLEYNFSDATVADIVRLGSAVKIDNIDISTLTQPSINIAIEENGCIPEPPPPPQNYLPTIVDLILSEEPVDPPVEEPTIQKISGTFSLPAGVVPTDDVLYEITTAPFESFVVDGQRYNSTDQVTITAANSSPMYEIFIPPAIEQTTQYKISFRCLQGCEGLNVTTDGYWRNGSKVVGEINATSYRNDQSHTVNLEMEHARIFSGNLNFPVDRVPPGGDFFSVNLISLNQGDSRFWNYFSTIVGVPAGAESVPFSIGVPSDDPVSSGGWILFVNCIFCDSQYEQGLQYSTNILTGNPLSVNGSNAVLFPVVIPSNFNNLQLTPLAASAQ